MTKREQVVLLRVTGMTYETMFETREEQSRANQL